MGSNGQPDFDNLYDLLVIGGGPAGLSAAVTIARQLHTAVIFDSLQYRNSSSNHMHLLPSWDHREPSEFRAAARKDILQNYSTIRYENTVIQTIRKIRASEGKDEEVKGKGDENEYFEVTESASASTSGREGQRTWRGRKVLLAMGVRSNFPEGIDGYADCWGRGVYHCLFCHGLEQRGERSGGVLAVQSCAVPQLALRLARNVLQLQATARIYTNGDDELARKIDAELEKGKKANNKNGVGLRDLFLIEPRKIARLARGKQAADVVVTLADGEQFVEAFVAHNPKTSAKNELTEQLGLKMAPNGDIDAAFPSQQTSVKGVFIAGDCQNPFKIMPCALSSGSIVASSISAQLQAEKYGHQSPF